MSWKNRRSSKAEALALVDEDPDPVGAPDDGEMAAVHVLRPGTLPPPDAPAPLGPPADLAAPDATVRTLPAPSAVTVPASADAAGAAPAPRLLALAPPLPAAPPPIGVLVEGIAGSLTVLRSDLGVAYPTSVWLDEVLPGIGVSCSQPVVLRDLLGVCALEAGGVRTDLDVLGDGEGEIGRVAYELHLALAGLIARARVLPLEDVLPPVVPLA